MQTFRRKHAQVLQIALAPAAVARGEVDQRGRALLVTAAERRQHINGVAGAQHQRGLDKIMAENVAAEGRAPAQRWQAAMGGESLDADDRVVAPVIALASRPDGDAGGDDRTINAGGELLHAREQRVAIDDERQGLNDPGVGIVLHRRGEATIAWPVIRLSASSTTICAKRPPQRVTKSSILPALRLMFFARCR